MRVQNTRFLARICGKLMVRGKGKGRGRGREGEEGQVYNSLKNLSKNTDSIEVASKLHQKQFTKRRKIH